MEKVTESRDGVVVVRNDPGVFEVTAAFSSKMIYVPFLITLAILLLAIALALAYSQATTVIYFLMFVPWLVCSVSVKKTRLDFVVDRDSRELTACDIVFGFRRKTHLKVAIDDIDRFYLNKAMYDLRAEDVKPEKGFSIWLKMAYKDASKPPHLFATSLLIRNTDLIVLCDMLNTCLPGASAGSML
nr:hypothetical protein [Candidatus Sigynarchaeota archaeon]